jgi:CubicO group peptidase (beta-lactamase class C family)
VPGTIVVVTTSSARRDVQGHCEPGFEAVADLLADNLRAGREIGASIGVYSAGRPVVQIWGGLADREPGIAWGEHTVTPIASISKALATVTLLVLAEQDMIDLAEPIATYWPAFAQNGKSDIPIHLVLSQRSGVAALETAISNDDATALDPVLRLIEQQRPWWRPGTKHGYHAVTYGFIISGIVRAVTGRTVGQYFAEEIAAPLGLDLFIGLPSIRHSLVAPMVGPTQIQAVRGMLRPVWIPYVLGLLNRRSASYRATFGGSAAGFNDHEELVRYDVEDPSAGAVGNGSSLARLFAAVIGVVDGRRLISDGLMNAARQPQASGRDVVLRMRTNWGLGFLLPGGPMWPDLGVPGLFGFPGLSLSRAVWPG